MRHGKFNLSLTTGGLFLRESVQLARLHVSGMDWHEVRQRAAADNLLQARTISSSQRQSREIISRLKTLQSDELDYLIHAAPQEQAYLLWLAICRYYPIIAAFAVDVLHERYLSLLHTLHYEDFDAFCNKQSAYHPELDALSQNSRKKFRQVLFRVLRETDILSAANTINGALLSPRLVDLIRRHSPGELLFFPVIDSEFPEATS